MPNDETPVSELVEQWLDAHARLVEAADEAREAILASLVDGASQTDVERAERLARDAQDRAAKWIWLNGQYLGAQRQTQPPR